MAEHVCDPRIDVDISDTPLTELRTLRVRRVVMDEPDPDALTRALDEFGDCPKCLRQAVFCAVSSTVTALDYIGTPAERLMACELMIGELETRVRQQGGAS